MEGERDFVDVRLMQDVSKERNVILVLNYLCLNSIGGLYASKILGQS